MATVDYKDNRIVLAGCDKPLPKAEALQLADDIRKTVPIMEIAWYAAGHPAGKCGIPIGFGNATGTLGVANETRKNTKDR